MGNTHGFQKGYASRREIKVSLETRLKQRKARLGKIPWNKGIKNFFGSKENHPRWIPDRSKLKTGLDRPYDTKYKYWMLEVKKRDYWKCRIDNTDCKGRLEAHHILPWRNHPELRYVITNGITLCKYHHPRKRIDEINLSPYFQKLVAEIK